MTGTTERFQQALNKGHTAAWDQMWDHAATYYRQALEEIPGHPKALTSLALALYELKDYEEALVYYQLAAGVLPNDPIPLERVAELQERIGKPEEASESFMKAAELYIKNRDVDKAIELWTHVISRNPSHMLAHSRLALVYERLGRKFQAIVEYLAIASILQHAGEMQKALQAVNQALKLSPESAEARQALAMIKTGRLLPKPSRPRGATGPLPVSALLQLESPKPQEIPDRNLDPIGESRQNALAILAGMLFDQPSEDHDLRKGMQALVRGVGWLGSQQVDQTRIILHLSQAIDLQAQKQENRAIEELNRALDAGLEHPAAYYLLGCLLVEGNRYESAIRNLQRAVNHVDFALGARLLLGRTLLSMGRAKDASVELLEALRLADTQAVPAYQAEEINQLYEPIVEAYYHQTDLDMHAQLCKNILDLLIRPRWMEHLLHARQQLPVQAQGNSPMPLAEILTEARSSQVVESISKIHQLARNGYFRTAMEEAFRALQFAPTYLPLHIYMGELLLKQNHFQDAMDKFKAVGRSYGIRGEANRAISLFKRVVDIAPMDMEARSQMIELLVARGQIDDAIGEYMRLADVYYNLADLVQARETYNNALNLAQQYNVNRTLKVKILHRIADIDLQSLDWRMALRVFEQIRSLQPDDEKARTTLVDTNFRLGQESQAIAELTSFITYLNESGRRDKALAFLEGVVENYPKQPAIYRHLGEQYRLSGKNAEAIKNLDTAGELFLKAGNRAAAVETVMAILSLNPPNATDYRRLLAQMREHK